MPSVTRFLSEHAWMLPIIHNHFWFATCFALLAPFYPELAKDKKVDEQAGFVFSTFKAAMLIGAITCDFIIPKLTAKVVYLTGMFGTFVFACCMASLYWCGNGSLFLGLSFVLAFFGGNMATWYTVCMYGVLTERFANSQGVIIAGFEFLFGIGNMMGTAVGGMLIDLWAFPLPFFLFSSIYMITFPIILKRGPVPKRSRRSQSMEARYGDLTNSGFECSTEEITTRNEEEQTGPSFWLLAKSPLFVIDMVTVMLSWVVLGFNEPTLQPYLHDTFEMSDTNVGLVFMAQYMCYAIGALISGGMWYANQTEFFLFISQTLSALSFVLVGPISFVPWEPSVPFVVAAQICVGISMAGQFVCGFAHALNTAISLGFPDNLRTSSFVSSATFVSIVSGAIITPPIAEKLVNTFKYRKGCVFFFVPISLWALVTAGVWLKQILGKRSRTDSS